MVCVFGSVFWMGRMWKGAEGVTLALSLVSDRLYCGILKFRKKDKKIVR